MQAPRRERGPIVCFGCHQPGHHIRDCPTRPPQNQFNQGPRKRFRDDNYQNSNNTNNNENGSAQPTVDPIRQRLLNLCIRLGEKSELQLEKSIEFFVESLGEELEKARNGKEVKTGNVNDMRNDDDAIVKSNASVPSIQEYVINILWNCCKSMPQKLAIYATVLALLHVRCQSKQPDTEMDDSESSASLPNLIPNFVQRIINELEESLVNYQFDAFRVTVRLLSYLVVVNLIRADEFYEFLCALNKNLVDLKTSSSTFTSLQFDYLLFVSLHIIPFIAAEQHTSIPFLRFVDDLRNTMKQRSSSPNDAQLFRNSEVSENIVDILWKVISDRIGSQNWECDVLISPYKMFPTINELTPSQFSFPSIKFPKDLYIPTLFPVVSFLTAEDRQDLKEAVVLSAYDTCLLHILFNDLMIAFEPIHREGVHQLLSIPLPFIKKEATGDKETIPYHSYLMESIFSQILMIPLPQNRLAYYGMLIIDLFKLFPQTMPPIIGAVMNNIFDRLDDLDWECFDRLVDWFSFHLSNFSYVWPWQNWEAVNETPEYTPQRMFVRETLAKISLLSYPERIKLTLPLDLKGMMPPQAEGYFRYRIPSSENNEDHMKDPKIGIPEDSKNVAKTLLKIMEEAPQVERMLTELSTLPLEWRVSVFIQCLLHYGSPSYSHFTSVAERYVDVLKTLMKEGVREQREKELVENLGEYWRNSDQHVLILLGKFLRAQVISSVAALDWACANPTRLHHCFTWKVIDAAIRSSLPMCAATIGEQISLVANEARKPEKGSNEPAKFLKYIIEVLSRTIESCSGDADSRPIVVARSNAVLRRYNHAYLQCGIPNHTFK